MKLFRIAVRSGMLSAKKSKGIFYVISDSKENAIEYVKRNVRDGIEVSEKACCLGDEYSGIMFGKVETK